jgi:hypothetical protein
LETFRFYFDRRKTKTAVYVRFIDVYLEDISVTTFQRRKGGRWGWYLAAEERGRSGYFGEIHLVASRVRPDLVAHELTHVLIDWLGGRPINARNEERICRLFDELTRNFWREYAKVST